MTDILEQHIKNTKIGPFSGASVVQEVMSMKAGPVRRLLKDLVGESIEAPSEHIIARLAACKLIMREFKHRKESITEGLVTDTPIDHKKLRGREWTSLLPFTLEDYAAAVEYANRECIHYAALEPEETDDDGNAKRGRKGGGAFAQVQDYMLAHLETFDKSNRADEVAKTISKELDTPETTTLQYVYKCRRLRKQGDI